MIKPGSSSFQKKEYIQQILKECHDVPTAGYPGRDITIRRVSESYFWPRMRKDVAKYVKNCKVCQQHKVEQTLPSGFMGKRMINRPWEMVAADIKGPFPRSTQGNEYILIFEDLFSRWIECIADSKS